MSRAPLPEVRGSHVAAVIEINRAIAYSAKAASKERRRAKKIAKAKRKAEEHRRDVMQQELPVQQPKKRASRSRAKGIPLSPALRRRLIAVTELFSEEVVAAWAAQNEYAKCKDPLRAAEDALAIHLGSALRTSWEVVHRRLERIVVHFERVARERGTPIDRVKHQDPPPKLPAPSVTRPALGGSSTVAASPPPNTNDVLIRFLEQQNQMMQSQGQMMAHLVMTLGNVQSQPGPAALTMPARPVFGEPTHDLDPEPPPPTEFKDMVEGRQRAVLNSMHRRYADIIKKDGTTEGDQYKEAWNISYEYFERHTGIAIRDMASAESDGTGHRCRPLDIIFARGLQVRFYDIVRDTWNH